jgi:hypothetical protein
MEIDTRFCIIAILALNALVVFTDGIVSRIFFGAQMATCITYMIYIFEYTSKSLAKIQDHYKDLN